MVVTDSQSVNALKSAIRQWQWTLTALFDEPATPNTATPADLYALTSGKSEVCRKNSVRAVRNHWRQWRQRGRLGVTTCLTRATSRNHRGSHVPGRPELRLRRFADVFV